MPVMTRSARHSETTVSMINPNALLNDPFGSPTQREYVSFSRHAAVQERSKHKSSSGVGTAPPWLMPSADSDLDEKSAVPLSDSEARPLPSRSSSTTSRFVGRLGTGVHSLSSLRTIPSWRNTLPRAHKTYAKIERGHDVGGGVSRSDSPSLPRLRDETSVSQRSSSGDLRNNSLRHRRRHASKRRSTKSQNNVLHTPLSDLLTRFSHAMTISTSVRDSGTSSSSLGAQHSSSDRSSSSSTGSYIPFPSMSDESSRTFPSPYSPDAAAVFQAPSNKSDTPHFFDGHVKFRGIFEDRMQVVFEEAADRSSSSASTSTSVTSARTASKPSGLLARSKRRVGALARAVTPARCKFLSIFDKKRSPPRPAYYDDDPAEYDIPCLAYVTCLW